MREKLCLDITSVVETQFERSENHVDDQRVSRHNFSRVVRSGLTTHISLNFFQTGGMSASDIVYRANVRRDIPNVDATYPYQARHTPAKPDILLLSGLFIQTFCVQKAAAGQKPENDESQRQLIRTGWRRKFIRHSFFNGMLSSAFDSEICVVKTEHSDIIFTQT